MVDLRSRLLTMNPDKATRNLLASKVVNEEADGCGSLARFEVVKASCDVLDSPMVGALRFGSGLSDASMDCYLTFTPSRARW